MTGFIFSGVVLALIGAGLMVAALIPEDAMVAIPLPAGNVRRALLPIGVFLLLAGVVLPAVGVTTIEPPTATPTPTMEDTATMTFTPTRTRTPSRTPFPTIARVSTATPRPPTNTPRPPTATPPGTLVPQQSLKRDVGSL